VDTTVVQSVAKGAAKTFIQAFLAIFVPLFVAWAAGHTAELSTGAWGDVNLAPVAAFGLAASLAAIAAVFSYVQNKVGAIPS
jgi:hypothetical protein